MAWVWFVAVLICDRVHTSGWEELRDRFAGNERYALLGHGAGDV